MSPALAGGFFTTSATWETLYILTNQNNLRIIIRLFLNSWLKNPIYSLFLAYMKNTYKLRWQRTQSKKKCKEFGYFTKEDGQYAFEKMFSIINIGDM